MDSSKKNAPLSGASSSFVPFRQLSEEEQIAQLIKLFDLKPKMRTSEVIEVTDDRRTRFYQRQDPKDKLFDPSYPKEIEERRSSNAPRHYWTIDILRWLIRQASR